MLPNWQSFVFSVVMTLQHWTLIIVMMPTLSSQSLSLWQTPVPPVTTNLSSCQLSVFDDNIFPSWWSPWHCILTSSQEQTWNGHLNLYMHPQISNIKRTIYIYIYIVGRQSNCWSLRCSWSIACRRCSNYIFLLDLASMDREKTTARWDQKHFSFEI